MYPIDRRELYVRPQRVLHEKARRASPAAALDARCRGLLLLGCSCERHRRRSDNRDNIRVISRELIVCARREECVCVCARKRAVHTK